MSFDSEYFTSNCICDTLLSIVEAQDRVDASCATSCTKAIQELVEGGSNSAANTIPVMLTCKSTCLPYIGVGALRVPHTSTFSFPISPIFRVIEVDPETCCATLELISTNVPLEASGPIALPAVLAALTGSDLTATGACITADLHSFSSVTCLSPIK